MANAATVIFGRGRLRCQTLVVCLLGLAATPALGQTADVPADRLDPAAVDAPRAEAGIDPTLAVLRAAAARRPVSASIFARSPLFDRTGAEVTLRFERRLSAAEIAELERLGVQWRRGEDGRLRQVGSVYAARAPYAALDRLRRWPGLRRIEAQWQAGVSRPMEASVGLTGADVARRWPSGPVSGQGVLVGLIDTGIDVFHPAFFRADGGMYAWIDVDRNGAFAPWVDAVDLDGDGQADRNEALGVLDATVVEDFATGQFTNNDGELQADRDWVFADMNRDGARNVGRQAGFSEEDRAYGEPIFVVDDVDGDRRLGADEKLVRLGTSKIRRLVTGEATYARGDDLIDAGEAATEDSFHGTGAAGIVVGGQPGYHARVGMAPDAELVVYAMGSALPASNARQLDYLADAADRGVDVMLHEWTNPYTQPLDGSTNLEAAMDAARAGGIAQVNPVGNLNVAQKHAEAPSGADGSVALGFEVGEGFEFRDELLPYRSIFGSLQWIGSADAASVAVRLPGGARLSPAADGSAQAEGVRLDVALETTSRGTGFIELYLESTTDAALPAGQWTVELGGVDAGATVYGRISDAYSNWQRGVGWLEPVADTTTIAFPSTADAAMGVAAFAARGPRFEGDVGPGQLRAYSGRGPRVGGAAVVDVAAPDDPFVPLGATPPILQAGWGRTWWTRFGGTSGAAPHVAGALALLREQRPDASADDLEEALLGAARVDAAVTAPGPVPNHAWGHGRLDAFAALYGQPAPQTNQPPRVELVAEVFDDALVLDAVAEDPDGDRLEYRYDLDYDGQWDTAWSSQPAAQVSLLGDSDSRRIARVAVRDEAGASAGALLAYRLRPAGGDAGGDSRPADADAAGGADAAADAGRGGGGDGWLCSSAGTSGAAPSSTLIFGLAGLAWWRRRRCARR